MQEKLNYTLTNEIKADIDRSLVNLMNDVDLTQTEGIIRDAKKYLQGIKEKSYSEDISSELGKGWALINEYENSSNNYIKKIALGALKYLLDPWDIIPDFIGEEGLRDDVYVINKALALIKNEKNIVLSFNSVSKKKNGWVIYNLDNGAGQHFAKRAKELGLLDTIRRKALNDISKKYTKGYQLTEKQVSFFEILMERLINDGFINHKCPITNCKYCSELSEIYG